MKYYKLIKINELQLLATTLMNLRNIINQACQEIGSNDSKSRGKKYRRGNKTVTQISELSNRNLK